MSPAAKLGGHSGVPGHHFIWYEHTSKAGGTAFCACAKQNLPINLVSGPNCFPRDHQTSHAFPNGHADGRVGSMPKKDLLSYLDETGHVIVANEWDVLPRWVLKEPRAILVTSLRDPVDRVLSAYSFFYCGVGRCATPWAASAVEWATQPTDITPNPSSRALWLGRAHSQPWQPNWYVRKFSGRSWSEATFPEDVVQARAALERFHVLLLPRSDAPAEEHALADSLAARLAAHLGWTINCFADRVRAASRLPWLHAPKEANATWGAADVSAHDRARIGKANSLDVEFFVSMRGRLAEAAAAQGSISAEAARALGEGPQYPQQLAAGSDGASTREKRPSTRETNENGLETPTAEASGSGRVVWALMVNDMLVEEAKLMRTADHLLHALGQGGETGKATGRRGDGSGGEEEKASQGTGGRGDAAVGETAGGAHGRFLRGVHIFCAPVMAAKYEALVERHPHRVGRIYLRAYRGTPLVAAAYNTLLTTRDFWAEVYGDLVLLYQIDAVVCPASTFSFSRFFQLDYVGANWCTSRGVTGNCGPWAPSCSRLLQMQSDAFEQALRASNGCCVSWADSLHSVAHNVANKWQNATQCQGQSFRKFWGGNGGISLHNRHAQMTILGMFARSIEIDVKRRARSLGKGKLAEKLVEGEDGFTSKYMAIAGYRVATPEEAAEFGLNVVASSGPKSQRGRPVPLFMHVHDGGNSQTELIQTCGSLPESLIKHSAGAL